MGPLWGLLGNSCRQLKSGPGFKGMNGSRCRGLAGGGWGAQARRAAVLGLSQTRAGRRSSHGNGLRKTPSAKGTLGPSLRPAVPNQHEHTRQTQPMPTTTQAGPAPALGTGAQPGETQPYPPGQDDAGSNRKLRPKT